MVTSTGNVTKVL